MAQSSPRTPVDTAKAYCAELEQVGVRATHDPKRIVPPCIILTPPTVRLDSNCGGEGEWTAFALAATAGDGSAWGQLDQLVARVLGVLPVENVSPAQYQVDEMTSFPAFSLTWVQSTEWRVP